MLDRPELAKLRRLHDQFVAEQRFSTRVAPATLQSYRVSFDLLLQLVPMISLSRLNPATLTLFFQRLETRSRALGYGTVQGVKTSTIATHRGRLGRFFTWLAARKLIAANPFQSLPYPHVEYESRQYLGKGEIERIFATLVSGGRTRFQRRRDQAIFATLLYAGLRRGELLGLRLSDINLDRQELRVRPETSKSRSGRVVPINSALLRPLEEYYEERRRVPSMSPHVFISSSGAPLTEHGLKHLTGRVAARSGVRFHPHQFRHTFAVNFLHASGDVAKLKQLLGHRDIRMTSGYLRSLPPSSMQSSMEALSIDALLS